MANERGSNARAVEVGQASEEVQATDVPESNDPELDQAEREFWKERAAENRKLEELAARVPGPYMPSPRDKIWCYLIAEYGFSPETLWRISPRQMELYIEARQGRETEKPSSEAVKEDWRPASEAVTVANERGYDITLDWISKRKDKLRTRPRELPGRHQLEVEMGSLAQVLFAEQRRQPGEADTDEPSGSERDKIETRKRFEKERKLRSLS